MMVDAKRSEYSIAQCYCGAVFRSLFRSIENVQGIPILRYKIPRFLWRARSFGMCWSRYGSKHQNRSFHFQQAFFKQWRLISRWLGETAGAYIDDIWSGGATSCSNAKSKLSIWRDAELLTAVPCDNNWGCRLHQEREHPVGRGALPDGLRFLLLSALYSIPVVQSRLTSIAVVTHPTYSSYALRLLLSFCHPQSTYPFGHIYRL